MFLCEKNVGICKCGCGKSCGELINEFFYGAGEVCMMANAVIVKVMGAAGKKNTK